MSKFRILILEDYAHVAFDFRDILEEEGYEVDIALSVEEAKEKLSSGFQPDLALLDIQIGENKFGGIQVAEFIQQNRSIPIIFITGHGNDPEIFNKAKDVFPAAFFEKGTTNFQEEVPKTIELAINNFINKQEDNSAAAPGVQRIGTTPAFTQGKICINANVKAGGEVRKRRVIIPIGDILYFEAQGYETKIQTKSESYTLAILFKKFNDQLQQRIGKESSFWRVQRSYVVNLANIEGYDSGNVYLSENGEVKGIPIRQDAYLKLKEEWFPPFKA